MKHFWIFALALVSNFSAFAKTDSSQILYIRADALAVDFSNSLPGAGDKVVNSAKLFDLILNKTDSMWRSENGKNICILADSGSPVPENIIKEAKVYGFVFKNDSTGKICHQSSGNK